jgi:lipid II:glycine glycyltransferase (peptidoglycan interpeptide bridge formation enzyme)
MHIEKLTTEEFQRYTFNHVLTSYNQTLQYAKYKELEGYKYDLIGLKDQYNNILAASLILFKTINNKYTYGYAPRGFLIDYKNIELLKTFNKLLYNYYKNYKVIFIKINPYIYIS